MLKNHKVIDSIWFNFHAPDLGPMIQCRFVRSDGQIAEIFGDLWRSSVLRVSPQRSQALKKSTQSFARIQPRLYRSGSGVNWFGLDFEVWTHGTFQWKSQFIQTAIGYSESGGHHGHPVYCSIGRTGSQPGWPFVKLYSTCCVRRVKLLHGPLDTL